jgi:hypothetical protein
VRQIVEPEPPLRWWQPQDLLIAKERKKALRVLAAWTAACAVSVASGLLATGWSGIPVRLGPLAFDLSFYPPLTLCVLLTLWIGPWWGIAPAYLTSLALSLHEGMPLPTSAVFSLATPIALTVLWSSMVMLNVSPSLRAAADVARFAVLALVATGSSSVGALLWTFHHGLSFSRGLEVWQGWVLGDFLQIALVVGPLLYLLDRPARRWLDAHLEATPRTTPGNSFFVGVFILVLLVMIAIGATAARLFLLSLGAAPGSETISFAVLRDVLRQGAVFLGIYTLIFLASVIVFSSTLGSQIERHLRDIAERQRAQEERERLISELQEALAHVRVLSGLLPICAHCKKIRDDRGYWNQIEAYLRERAPVEFSHGICPDCRRTQYPEYPPT